MAVAESFNHDSSASVLSGVVMRRDFVIDGFVFGRATLKEDDATDVILSMFQRLHMHDISYLYSRAKVHESKIPDNNIF